MASVSIGRRAGILVPLFSIRSASSWGIGEIGDIARAAAWLHEGGLRLLQFLPINEMPPGETSPYSALSAMAIDPQFISMAAVEDFQALGGEAQLEPDLRRRLAAARSAERIEYTLVRELKATALRGAFARFRDVEWAADTRRAGTFRAYIDAQAWWLADYALFRALHARFDERPWTAWPADLRERDARALEEARRDLADDILYRQYVQWIADTQWADARRACTGLAFFGDLPFMVSCDSADVWARQDEFMLDASVGVPPDAFSATGQDWGLPVYRWDVHAARDFDWLRHRARRNVMLFDGYRIDHLVGFYRTYFRPLGGGEPRFTPEDEMSQTALGERILQVFADSGAEIVAEDLGVVPDFVRASLAQLGIPGYKVLRWERRWELDGQPFIDPADYPESAVATSGTHDTEPMAVWWEGLSPEERTRVLAMPSLRARLADEGGDVHDLPEMSLPVREALLVALLASPAALVVLPLQDVFGWRDRINQPATVGDFNWTWRMPWPVDRPPVEAVDLAMRMKGWNGRFGR